MRITIIGATGFIGRHLTAALRARGDEVVTASLRDPAAAAQACCGSQAIVNLAGEPVAQRWTPEVKAKIRSSRVDAPSALFDALTTLDDRPQAYVSSSAIGYYGTSETATFDETSPAGSDLLADVCVAWEAVADRFAELDMRVAKIRTGIVLGTDGGALAQLLPLFKLGVGGIVASGKQWYSWIHVDDEVGVYLHAIDGAAGVLDATAPNPATNAEFTHALGKALHRPTFFPVPEFVLTMMLGEAALVVTRGQRVLPTRTLETGYRFKYETLDAAMTAIAAS
ncbi:MAG: TIGR01777 family protein [Candidatus Eremiobacteraeota bacterium]|nr:TIGR01777 family protein [Candidatus Eremiobacteraeota bacterium]